MRSKSHVPRPRVVLSRLVVREPGARWLRNQVRQRLRQGEHEMPADNPQLSHLVGAALAGNLLWLHVWPAGDWTWT